MSLALAGWAAGACRSAALPPVGRPTDPARLERLVQVLLRAEVRGEGKSGKLRLALRYWGPQRFELRASDLFGRGVWTLAAEGDLGLWSDLRAGLVCRFAAERRVRLDAVSLPLPSGALPAVLLGAIPTAVPESGASAPTSDGGSRIEFGEPDGRRWQMRLDADGSLRSWQVEEQGTVRLSWERSGARRRLRAQTPDFEIEWREVAREPLVAAPPDLALEARGAPECANGHLP